MLDLIFSVFKSENIVLQATNIHIGIFICLHIGSPLARDGRGGAWGAGPGAPGSWKRQTATGPGQDNSRFAY